MEKIFNELILSLWGYLKADWYILLAGILIASYVKVYVDSEKLKDFFMRRSGLSIPGAVAFGALTPLCACGTTAVMLSMFISALPWGPVMAFLISSPLTSPSEYLFETAFLGSRFASSMLVASIILGILAGIFAHLLEKHTNFFRDQFRLVSESPVPPAKLCCDEPEKVPGPSCCNGGRKNKGREFLAELYNTGVKKILFYFMVFILVGKFIELLIPREWIMLLFSSSKAYSIPLAALLGLPLYLTDASALPLLKSFLNAGASEGAVLAFLMAGKATGIPVMAGMATLMKKRAMGFYIGMIFVGSVLAGYIYQAVLFIVK